MILTEGIKLFHASYISIEQIDLSLCAEGKDFGKGFYVTTDYNQACRFIRSAIGKAKKNNIQNIIEDTGFISVFEFNKSTDSLKYFEFESADETWLHCIAAHRQSGILQSELQKWKDYDIITGKIASDTTNQVLTAYINGFYGEIGSYDADQTAIRLLIPEKLSNQICFRSEKAIKSLEFTESISVKLEK